MSVSVWNFEIVGPKKQDFGPKKKYSKSLHYVNTVNDGMTKSAKLYFQSQFLVSKSTDFFFDLLKIKNINLGGHFLLKILGAVLELSAKQHSQFSPFGPFSQ